jgi:hypothetical protein
MSIEHRTYDCRRPWMLGWDVLGTELVYEVEASRRRHGRREDRPTPTQPCFLLFFPFPFLSYSDTEVDMGNES